MTYRIIVAMIAVAGVALCPSPREVRADGCFVWNSGADLKEPTQRAIIGWDARPRRSSWP